MGLAAMRKTPVSPPAARALPPFADHLDLMFGTGERAIKTPDPDPDPDKGQDHVEVWRHIDGNQRY